MRFQSSIIHEVTDKRLKNLTPLDGCAFGSSTAKHNTKVPATLAITTLASCFHIACSFDDILLYFQKMTGFDTRLLFAQLSVQLCKVGKYEIILAGWMSHVMNLLMPYATNKCADQHAHPRSLISAFIVPCLDSIILLVSITEISSLCLASLAA